MSEKTEAEETLQTGLLDEKGEPISTEDAIAKANGEDPKAGKDENKDDDSIDRPEWLPEKFKKPEDLAKSYAELEKTLREKGKLPPEKYEFEETYGLQEDELTEFSDFAKEAGLTNAQADAVMKYAKDIGYFDLPDQDEEFKKLGDQKDEVMNTLERYASPNILPSEREAFEGMVYTAAQAKVLYKMVRASQRANTDLPSGKETGNPAEGVKDLEVKLRSILSESDINTNRDKQAKAAELAGKITEMKKRA